MPIGVSLDNLYGFGLLLCGSNLQKGELEYYYCVSLVASHNSLPPFVVEVAHVQNNPQVVCNEEGPVQ